MLLNRDFVTNATHRSFIYAILIASLVLMLVVLAGKRNKDIPRKADWDSKRLWAYFVITLCHRTLAVESRC